MNASSIKMSYGVGYQLNGKTFQVENEFQVKPYAKLCGMNMPPLNFSVISK